MVHKSNVISVYYTTRDPKRAAQVLQALGDAYIDKHMATHRASGEFKFFDQQAKLYEQGLDDAKQSLTDFTKSTGIVSAAIERDSALRQANEFDTTAQQARTAVIETEQRVAALKAQLQRMQPRMTTVIRTSSNVMLMQQLKSTLLTLQLKRTELLTKYEPTYQLVQEVDRQIADTKSSIAAEEAKPVMDESTDQDPNYLSVRTELTRAEANLEGLKARATSAASMAEHYHKTAEHLDESEVTQEGLQRAAKSKEEEYLLYERKREEARISDALDQRGILNVALAEHPIVPALPTRSRMNFGILMLLMAGTFSITLAFVADFIDPSFRTPDEASNYLGVPVLAALPSGRE